MPEAADVIVIGAGAAGIAACRALCDAGLSVIVLEASERIGGRASSSDVAQSMIELGAEFIHGEGAPTHGLCEVCNVRVIPAPRKKQMWWAEAPCAVAQPRTDLSQKFRQLLGRLETSMSALSDGESGASIHPDASLAEHLRSIGFHDAESLAVADVYLAQTCCAPLAKLSMADLAAESRRDFAGDEEFRLVEGYSTLLQRYSAGLPIHLSKRVASVTRSDSGVAIRTSDAVYTARAAIVTVSVKLLQDRTIEFTPPLSSQKLAALDAMEMPAATKLVYVFDKPRWDASMLYLLHTGNTARWWTRDNVITCFVTATRAEVFDDLPEAEALSVGLSELCALLGDQTLRTHVQSMARISWAKDDLVRGGCGAPVGYHGNSPAHAPRQTLTPTAQRRTATGQNQSRSLRRYAYVKTGGAWARQALAATEGGRVFFAGEATAYALCSHCPPGLWPFPLQRLTPKCRVTSTHGSLGSSPRLLSPALYCHVREASRCFGAASIRIPKRCMALFRVAGERQGGQSTPSESHRSRAGTRVPTECPDLAGRSEPDSEPPQPEAAVAPATLPD